MNLVESARVAGSSGKSWHDWVMSDEIQDVIASMEHFSRKDQDDIEKAFAEGRRERASTHGRIIWTTAPADYDGAEATELEVVGDYFGKPLRKIAVEPEGYSWQEGRYASGTYGVWDKDPIEEDRAVRVKQDAHMAEMAAVEAKRQAGAAWLRTASAAELADEDVCWEHGATYKDIRAERTRRHEEAEGSKRSAGMARLMGLVPDGVTLIDEGGTAHGPYGMRPVHRHAMIYHDVKLIHGWPDDVEHAKFEHGVGRSGGVIQAERILDLIDKGQLRHAKAGEVPPAPVVDRIGVERWKEIRRVVVGGKTVWVGRALFGSEDLVLDEKGKLVRAKKVVEAAIDAARAADAGAGAKGHALAGPVRPRTQARRRRPRKGLRVARGRVLKGRYGRPGGWSGESARHSLAARKGGARRR